MASSRGCDNFYLWAGTVGASGDIPGSQAPTFLISKDFVLSPEPEVTHQINLQNLKSFNCGILQISNQKGEPLQSPILYALVLNNITSIDAWFAVGEKNDDNIFHVHILLKTNMRVDACKRSFDNTFKKLLTFANFADQFSADLTFDLLKFQKCHKPDSMIGYFMKNPDWVCSNREHLLQLAYDIDTWNLNARFKEQDVASDQGPEMSEITEKILEAIYEHNCQTQEDIMRAAPATILKNLHKPGLLPVLNNCLQFVKATGMSWNPQSFMKYDPAPEHIHRILLYQGIRPSDFDPAFYAVLNKLHSKKNTLLLYGPSNSGKTGFFKGLKQCIDWGEIQNSENFTFEALVSKPIGFWEEPLISATLAEKCKLVFEGMDTLITIKYKKPQPLPRTPIFMTSNHLPWRFCSNEEAAFKNRMYIFDFNYDASDSAYRPRVTEQRCKCCFCKVSRGGSPCHSEPTTTTVQGGQQPLVDQSLRTSESSNVGSGSLLGPGEGTSRSYYCQSGSDFSDAEIGATHTSRPRVSSSSTIDRYFRHSESGSSDTDYGASSSFPRQPKHLVSRHSSGNTRLDSRRDGGRVPRKHAKGRRDGGPRNPIYQYSGFSQLGFLGTPKKGDKDSIQAQQSRLDQQMDAKLVTSIDYTIRVPTKQDWQGYISFLQHYYAGVCEFH
ncbi:nonstructural protein 1 [Galliform chaphamaparvovirus 6]|nr:nonstructural protein 1 [Galliform chaphamaparvovirus 6]